MVCANLAVVAGVAHQSRWCLMWAVQFSFPEYAMGQWHLPLAHSLPWRDTASDDSESVPETLLYRAS
eukprot:scaffold990_cov393-Prasinococcus_capsulatus_cf.AAC.38